MRTRVLPRVTWRPFLAAVVALALGFSGIPVSAQAQTSGPYEVAEGMEVWGYSNEAVTVSMLATDLGCSPKVAAGTAMIVDAWTQGNGGMRFTAAQLANAAQGVKQYMVDSGNWDSFADWLGSAAELGTGVLFDFRPWWDRFGLSTFAEEAAIPDTVVDGRTWLSGYAARWSLPWATASGLPGRTLSQWAVADGLALDVGFKIKTSTPSTTQGPWVTATDWWTEYTTSGQYRCMVCGATYSQAGRWLQAKLGTGEVVGIIVPPDSWCTEHLECDPGSEAAVVFENLSTEGAVGRMLLAGSALADPSHAVLGAVDTWGIPGYIPPGQIHEDLQFMESWGDDLSSKADDLASVVESMTVEGATLVERGIGGILDGVRGLLSWLGSFFDRIQAWVVSMTLPNEEWIRHVWKSDLEDLQQQMLELPPFSYIAWVQSLGELFESAGGS